MKVKKRKYTGRRKPVMMIQPLLPGTVKPDGSKATLEEFHSQVYDLGAFMHKYHGAELMTPEEGLQTIVKDYIAQDADIEKFWALRPDLKPVDWTERRADYLAGGKAWEGLAWAEGLDLDD